jgi:hypothetical protein
MEKLKPCPFCGANKPLLTIKEEEVFTEVGFNKNTYKKVKRFRISCYDIEQKHYYESEQEAIQAWNTRTEATK